MADPTVTDTPKWELTMEEVRLLERSFVNKFNAKDGKGASECYMHDGLELMKSVVVASGRKEI